MDTLAYICLCGGIILLAKVLILAVRKDRRIEVAERIIRAFCSLDVQCPADK